MTDPLVIAIGGSAGALEPLLAILAALPEAFAVPIVVVLHLPADRPSVLPELLGQLGPRPVVEIEDKLALQPRTIHVAPPNYHTLVERGGELALSVDPPVQFSRPSIDVVFESAADALGSRVIAVLLSGANDDGAQGVARIVRAGGIAVVQDPATAAHQAMPSAAVRALAGSQSHVHVVPPGQIARLLQALTAGTLAEDALR